MLNRDVARQVLSVALRHSKEWEQLIHYLEDQKVEKEVFDALRHSIAGISADILLEIINPIVAEHEELRPPGLNRRN